MVENHRDTMEVVLVFARLDIPGNYAATRPDLTEVDF